METLGHPFSRCRSVGSEMLALDARNDAVRLRLRRACRRRIPSSRSAWSGECNAEFSRPGGSFRNFMPFSSSKKSEVNTARGECSSGAQIVNRVPLRIGADFPARHVSSGGLYGESEGIGMAPCCFNVR